MNQKLKNIYLYSPSPSLHSLYNLLIANPPKGYTFIVQKSKQRKFKKNLAKNKLARIIYKIIKKFIDPVKKENEKFKHQYIGKVDLIFSAGRLVLRKDLPHIVDIVDKVTSLAGYDLNLFKKNKGYIEKALSAKDCKKIICFTEATKKDFLNELDTTGFAHKLEVVNFAIKPSNFKGQYKKNKITLLFIGSINNPDDFFIKGGLETLEAFKLLRKKYDNIELVIRCKLPRGIRKKYQIECVRFIEQTLSWPEVEELYKQADIFMIPAHNISGLAPLEAMSFELPLIGINTWATDEVIIDGFNGFLVEKSRKIPYEEKKFHLDVRNPSFLKLIRNVDKNVVRRIAEKTQLLINNPNLRKKLGENARFLVEEGKFSLKVRNEKLKRIFDEATELKKSDLD